MKVRIPEGSNDMELGLLIIQNTGQVVSFDPKEPDVVDLPLAALGDSAKVRKQLQELGQGSGF
ncbi:MAG: hypothetical protein PHO20_01390 [Candidatus Peribacteraceae bacterium]|nr:hypothetical protein [Candidatus Peribacteraceae bacterium]MDD5739402.1 hypothetical protein [Candidatus Peribacteraceae bacterium]